MPRVWSVEVSNLHWSARTWHIIARDENVEERRRRTATLEIERTATDTLEKERFQERYANVERQVNTETCAGNNDAENLHFWAVHGSWTYCKDCHKLSNLRLLPGFHKRAITKPKTTCSCTQLRYFTPNVDDIPHVLRNLSTWEVCSLRPLTIHTGEYSRAANGYRKKGGMFRLSWSDQSVVEQINALGSGESIRRAQAAYEYLMNNPDSSYRWFVERRDIDRANARKFNVYDHEQRKWVECCLWPNLYPSRQWCDCHLDGSQTRLSGKVSFVTKVMSSIADYGMTYELLHFHYDLWLFRTVSGAVTNGRQRHCSPARSLETKAFSTEYWKWQHRFLQDAVEQYGPPSLFITISPYEWSFPVPPWLHALRHTTGRGPTHLAAFETLHIAHVLEQIIRGYLCGSNDKRWSNNVFSYNRLATYKNVNTYFYRFEFQGRGTLHVHLLVWLKDISKIRLSLLRADIPWWNRQLAFDVAKLQKSNKPCMALRDDKTVVESINGTKVLSFYHPADAFALNLRGYISSLIPALRCCMDVQTSDGHGMILRYVTSYVSKWEDAYQNDSLYSPKVGPYQAAYRHLTCLKPLEPEMWVALSSIKVSWTSSRRKKFRVPPAEQLPQSVTYQKYLNRSQDCQNLSLLQWLRIYDEAKLTPTRYKDGTTLVGVKSASPLKDVFFFQYQVVNYPHTCTSQLFHRDHARLPQQIKHFASAYVNMPEMWCDQQTIKSYFRARGHKEIFVETIASYVQGLTDLFHLWQRQVMSATQIPPTVRSALETIVDARQRHVLEIISTSLNERDRYYVNEHLAMEDPCSGSEGEEECDRLPDVPCQYHETRSSSDWTKPIVITGKPGTGKTHCLHKAIDNAVTDQRSVLVATPTGFLASTYNNCFGTAITADTIHSAFQYPVSANEKSTVNWDIQRFDLLILDEISMVPTRIMEHVLDTISQLPTRPVVVMCGDKQQQRPIETTSQGTTQTISVLAEKEFFKTVTHCHLTTQHRCDDSELQEILNYIRYYRPSQAVLDKLHEGRVISRNPVPSDEEIAQALTENPTATILAVTRAGANRINSIAINKLFQNEIPLGQGQYDCELPPLPLYENMAVMITQNRDKNNNVVNGQRATIEKVQNNSVFLRLPSGTIVVTYLVTQAKPDGSTFTSYPFVPCYAMTICKSQGQTLEKVIVWLDSMFIPQGAAYVALSRVHKLDDLKFLVHTNAAQYSPVNLG